MPNHLCRRTTGCLDWFPQEDSFGVVDYVYHYLGWHIPGEGSAAFTTQVGTNAHGVDVQCVISVWPS